MRKSASCNEKNKGASHCAVTVQLIGAFDFDFFYFYFQNPKFQASNHRLWLYSPVCVGQGR